MQHCAFSFFFSCCESIVSLVFNPDHGITHMHYLSVSLSKTMALSDSSANANHDEAAQLASSLLNISLTAGDNGNHPHQQQQQQHDLLFNPTHRIDDDIDDTLAPRSLKVYYAYNSVTRENLYYIRTSYLTRHFKTSKL